MSGRLGDVMRLVLGAATDGERLAAVAALERVMAAEGLDLHEIGRRVDSEFASAGVTAPGDDAPPAGSAYDAALDEMVATIPDDEWPGIATWIVEQDEAWAATHGRRILRSRQRNFAKQMQTESLTLRLSSAQGRWLLKLHAKVLDVQARPPAQPVTRVNGETGAARPTPATDTAPDSWRRRSTHRATGKRQPTPTADKDARLRWIDAVATARKRASMPAEQPLQPTLFTGEEVRVLICLATRYRSWEIHAVDSNGSPVIQDDPQSAEQLGQLSGVTLRSVRRALAKAVAGGFLRIHRPGGKGRGRRSVYRLAVPHPRDLRAAVQLFG
jgi:hypothetical protein